MSVSNGSAGGAAPISHPGDRRVVEHDRHAGHPGAEQHHLPLLVVVGRPGPHPQRRGARLEYDLHRPLRPARARDVDAHVQPERRCARRGGVPDDQLRRRRTLAHGRWRRPRRGDVPPVPGRRAGREDPERQAEAVLHQRHGGRPGRVPDLEHLGGGRADMEQQAGADRRGARRRGRDLDRRMDRMGRDARGHGRGRGQLPARPDGLRRRRLPLARVGDRRPAGPSWC